MTRKKKTGEQAEVKMESEEQRQPASEVSKTSPAKEASNELDLMEGSEIEASSAETFTVEAPSINEVEELKKELNEARIKADQYLDGWQRAAAEFSNYKKRVDRDQSQAYLVNKGNIIKRFLEIIDDIDRALKTKPHSGEGAAWGEGIELIQRKFLGILDAEGVKTIQVEGQFFDPNYHEAITQEDSPDHQSGQIIGLVKQGYILGDRVLRPALVRVAR
jgi:molecular chaperone GrpE